MIETSGQPGDEGGKVGTRGLRVLGIVAFLALSAFTTGGVTRNAAAVTSWPSAAGYMGNNAIYMTTGILSGPDSYGFGVSVLPEFTPVKDTEYSGSNSVKNVAVAVAGERSTDVGGTVQFYEFYDSGGGYLDVHIPIALAGWFNYTGQDVECQYLSLTDNYLPHATMQIQGNNNDGVNVTGTQPLSPNAAVQNAEYDLALDAIAAIPILGTPVALYQAYKTYEGAAKVVGSPYTSYAAGAGARVIQSYDVINGTWWLYQGATYGQNVFGPQIYVDVHINKTDFTVQSAASTFNVQGQNFVSTPGVGCISGQSPGALVNLGISAYPAIEVEGTVYLSGAVVPNQVVSLSDGGSNLYTFATNGQGNYRFFAKPGTAYSLTTTYGNAQTQTTFTTGTDPTAPPMHENLVIPPLSDTASAGPNPVQAGVMVFFQTTLSGGYLYPVSYSWNFGDGTTGTGDAPTHVYGGSGTYNAVETVVDSSNPAQTARSTVFMTVTSKCSTGNTTCIDPASQTVYYGVCNFPTASFAGYAPSGAVGPFTYAWTFGDGKTGTGQTVSHTYPAITKTYSVTLTVTDSKGGKTTAPSASVAVKYQGACAPSP